MDFISTPSAKQLDRIFSLYARSFPKDEVEPEGNLRALIAAGKMDAHYAVQNGAFAGFALVFLYEDIALTAFLAVEEHARGTGAGSEMLSFISHMYEDCVRVVEIESVTQASDNMQQRQRREAFYLKNGYAYAGFSSMLYNTQLDIMTQNGNITPETYMALQKQMLCGKSFENIHLVK